MVVGPPVDEGRVRMRDDGFGPLRPNTRIGPCRDLIWFCFVRPPAWARLMDKRGDVVNEICNRLDRGGIAAAPLRCLVDVRRIPEDRGIRM